MLSFRRTVSFGVVLSFRDLFEHLFSFGEDSFLLLGRVVARAGRAVWRVVFFEA